MENKTEKISFLVIFIAVDKFKRNWKFVMTRKKIPGFSPQTKSLYNYLYYSVISPFPSNYIQNLECKDCLLLWFVGALGSAMLF